MKHVVFALTLFFPTVLNAAPSRPVVFIPGIFGSELSKNGEKLWGGIWSLNNLRRLTIDLGPRQPDDGVEATGIIKQVSLFGVIKVAEYAKTLFPILNDEGYNENNGNLFMFPYDWRQSNFETAKQLQKFMNSPALRGKQVDIIDHSMGGLVAEIYIKNLDGANRVKKLINIAVPFRGSVNTLRTLTDGWGTMQNGLAGGLGVVRRFALAMPSFYEMLPDIDNCCILGKAEDPERRPYNLLSADGWSRIRWLDDPTGIVDDGVREGLRRGSEIRELARKPYPPSVRVYYIAGAGIDTVSQFYVDKDRRVIDSYRIGNDQYRGDGVVVEESASNGDISQAFASFAEHQTIFNDDSAKTSLRRILCDTCGALNKYGFSSASAVTLDKTILSVSSVGISTSQNYVRQGEIVQSELRIGGEGAPLDKVDVRLQISDVSDGGDTVITEFALGGSLETPGLYKAEITALNKPGIVRLTYIIKGMASLSDYVVIVPKDE